MSAPSSRHWTVCGAGRLPPGVPGSQVVAWPSTGALVSAGCVAKNVGSLNVARPTVPRDCTPEKAPPAYTRPSGPAAITVALPTACGFQPASAPDPSTAATALRATPPTLAKVPAM